MFVAASQDKKSKGETTLAESDDNSSDYFANAERNSHVSLRNDYFANAETSSRASFEHDDEFTSNPEGKDVAEKGLTAKLFICLTVVFQQSLIDSFGLHHCWSASGDRVGLRQQS